MVRANAFVPLAAGVGLDSLPFTTALLDVMSDPVLMLVPESGAISYANPAAQCVFGACAASDGTRQGISDLAGLPVDALSKVRLMKAYEAAGAGRSGTVDLVLPRDDGRSILEFVLDPIAGPEGQVIAVMLVGRDMERRARAESQREQLFALVENSSDFIGMADAAGVPFYVNPAGRRMVSLDPDTPVAETRIPDYYPPDQQARVEHELLPALLEHGYWAGETYFRHFDTGAPIPVSDTHFAVRDPVSHDLIGFGTITRDITEARRAAEAQRAADRRKDEFIATLAHELRNPLAPILSGIELLGIKPDDPALVGRMTQIMRRQTQHLSHLVDDLLDLSRITRGRVTLQRQVTDVVQAVRHALQDTETQWADQSRHVHVNLPTAPLWADADPVRLVQIVSNLLTNAARYTHAEGNIWVAVSRQRTQARIAVKDDGVGIAPEFLDDVFDAFTQLDAHSEGLGIGLALVRSLVAQHGGTVEARSEGPGRGSEFVVMLPLTEAAAGPASVAGQAEAVSGRDRRVLLVDDNRDVAQGLYMLLQHTGAQVRMVHDGADALAMAAEFEPDMIFMDLSMPEINGLEVARTIRRTPSLRHVCLVAVTGWDQEAEPTEAAGFDFHLVKPVSSAELARVLRERSQVGPDVRESR